MVQVVIDQELANDLANSMQGGPLSQKDKDLIAHDFCMLINLTQEQQYSIFFKIKRYQKLGICGFQKDVWQNAIHLLSLREKEIAQWQEKDWKFIREVITAIRKFRKHKSYLQQALLGHKTMALSNVLYAYDQRYKKEQYLRQLRKMVAAPFEINDVICPCSTFLAEDQWATSYLILDVDLVDKQCSYEKIQWMVISQDFLVKQLATLKRPNHHFFVCQRVGSNDAAPVWKLVGEWATLLKMNPSQKRSFRHQLSNRDPKERSYADQYKITAKQFLNDKKAMLILIKR